MPKAKRNSPRIDQRQVEQRRLLVEQLRKIPIIQVACEKVSVSRATYYRWTNEDPAFADEVNVAIMEGTAFINDMAESQLITAIKDQNFAAISFWLRNRHKSYTNKVEVTTTNKSEMTSEERQLLERAFAHLRMTQSNETHYGQPVSGSENDGSDPSQPVGTPRIDEQLT